MAKVLYGVNALIAWCGVLLSFTLNISGYYVDKIDASRPTLLGNIPGGIDTPWERLFDWLTYFTIWSNVTVAIVMTMLVVRPQLFTELSRRGGVWRALRLDTLIMIIVTGLVFNVMLATGEQVGLDAVSNALQHQITPIVTVLVWLIAGPRGLITWRTIPAALVLPVAWLVWALARGTVIGAYPYSFLDVATNGWAAVLSFVGVIVVAALVLSVLLLGIDAVIRRFTGAEPETDAVTEAA